MKTKINLYASLLFSLLFVFQLSFGQQTKKKDHNLSFSILNHNSNIEKGVWFATIEKEKVCIQLLDAENSSNPSFVIGLCIPQEEFTVIDAEGFELSRSSGSIKFKGSFPNNKSKGDFTFVKNDEFEAFLNKEGITTNGDDHYYFFKLFLGDVSKEYVLGLKGHGYQPTLKQLGKLGMHDVDLGYINAIAKTNYKGLELDMLLKFAIHDISIEYINELEKVGYGNIDAQMIKRFAIHDVQIDYIKGLVDLGYTNLEPNTIKNFAVHDITLEYIRSLGEVGFENLDPGMLKKFAIHGITSDYVRSIRNTGINDPDASTFRKAKIHGLTANDIKRAKDKGHDSNELSDYVRLKIHGK